MFTDDEAGVGDPNTEETGNTGDADDTGDIEGDTEEEATQIDEENGSESPDPSDDEPDQNADDEKAADAAGPSADPSWEKVGANVIAALAADGEAHVIVSLESDVDPAQVAESQEQVLAQLDSADFTVGVAYENVPAIAGVVHSERALETLNGHPAVISVAENLELSGSD